MKGLTKILLINKKTNVVEETFEDENLITNALSNAFYLPTQYQRTLDAANDSGDSLLKWQNALMPPSRNALGGILLWDNVLEESVDNIYPPNNVKNVGYAGGNYSGSNAMRGTFNSLESGVITGGWRNVWDFDTAKCNNKIIKAITLTHVNCGDNGFSSLEETTNASQGYCHEGYFFSRNNEYHKALGFVTNGNDLQNDNNVMLYCTFPSTTTVMLYKRRKPNFRRIQISDINPYNSTNDFDIYTITLPSVNSYRNTKNAYLEGNTVHLVNYKTNTSIEHIRINLSDYSITTNLISVSGTSSVLNRYSPIIFVNDKYVVMFEDGKVLELTDTGVFIKQIYTVGFNNNRCLSTYMGKIFLSYISNGATDLVTYELNTNVRCIRPTNSYPIGQIIESKLRYPLMVTDNMLYNKYTSIVASNYYLGSINNLSTPITKTSSYNMKIVYDVLDG